MGFLNHDLEKTVKIQAEVIQDLERRNAHLTHELIHCLKHCKHPQIPHPVKLAYNFSSSIKNQTMADANLTIPGPTVTGTPLLTDIVTGNPVTRVVYHDGTVSNPDPTIASVTLNPDGTLTVVPLREGTITIKVNTLADYTNSLGVAVVGAAVPSDPFLVVVVAAPVADGVKLSYTFA